MFKKATIIILALLLASCGGEEEVTPAEDTPATEAPATETATPTEEAEPEPEDTATAIPAEPTSTGFTISNPDSEFRLFWRFVFDVSNGAIVAYREDAIWDIDINNYELVALQQVEYNVVDSKNIGSPTDRITLANGFLKLEDPNVHSMRHFIENFNSKVENALCTDPCCASPGGLMVSSNLADPSGPQDQDLPVFYFPNMYAPAATEEIFTPEEVEQSCTGQTSNAQPADPIWLDYLSGGAGNSSSFNFAGATHTTTARFSPQGYWHRIQFFQGLPPDQSTLHGLVDNLEIFTTTLDLPRAYTITTTPNVFWVGRRGEEHTDEGTWFTGDIRRIVFDPTNSCWGCGG